MSVIEVHNVYKTFQQVGKESKNILENLNFTIKRGTIYALVGASGCGKTTIINCLLGIQRIDKGEIKILDQKVKFQNISGLTKFIGFMPQQISLAPQLSISETFHYYACLQLIDNKTLKERSEMLCQILLLPSKNSLIKEMSNGQQRKVSFAVAILHNPQLIILDEPTVGLDLEIRERIWNFLQQQSSEKNVTVLFTTHYLSEIARANICGFHRNGRLIVESSYGKILQKYNSENIDEAFFKICYMEDNENIDGYKDEKIENSSELFTESVHEVNKIELKVIKGLLIKEFQRIIKVPSEIFISFILPIFYMLIFVYTIGGFPNDLQIGIVNYETNQCKNYQFNYTEQCLDEKISCEVLKNFKDVVQINYNSHQRAFEDFTKGKIFGILTIDANFTKSLTDFVNNYKIITDPSNFLFYGLIEFKIYTAVTEIIENFSKICDINVITDGISFESIKNGEDNIIFHAMEDHSVIMVLVLTFCIMMIHSVLSIYDSRSQGIWNRSIINGMKISEIFFAQIIQFICSAFIITFEMILILIFVVKVEILGSIWLTCLIIFLMAIDGCLFGLIVSIIFDSFHVITGFIVLLMVSSMSLSGLLWPIQGASEFIQIISYIYPLTIPGITMREIVFKASDLSFSNIQFKLLIFTLNILLHIFISIVTLKWRKMI